MRIFSSALLAALAFACGGKSKAPETPPPLAAEGSAAPESTAPRAAELSEADFNALMVQIVGFFGELGDGITAVASTCTQKQVEDPNAPAAEPPAADPKSKKKPPPPPPRPTITVLECTPEQCQQMATNIRGTLQKHDALLQRTKSFGDDEAAAQRAETWMQDNRPQVEPALQKMATGLRPCAENPAVIEAMNALGKGPGGG